MNKIFHKTQKNTYTIFILFFIVSILSLKTGVEINDKKTSVMNTSESIKEISKTQIPFIVNEGQLDKRVRYYTQTLVGRYMLQTPVRLFTHYLIRAIKE